MVMVVAKVAVVVAAVVVVIVVVVVVAALVVANVAKVVLVISVAAVTVLAEVFSNAPKLFQRHVKVGNLQFLIIHNHLFFTIFLSTEYTGNIWPVTRFAPAVH